MSFTDLFIRRPVLATVVNLIIVLLGLMAYQRLGIREYPNIDEPIVTVDTVYTGASAEIIESQVTQILEDSISGIEGISLISSISRAERSQISVTFRVTRNVDEAANDVRDRVSRVRGRLPDEIDEPIIAKVEADAQPIIYLSFSSDRHDPLFVNDIADRLVQDRLQTLPGVAEVRIFGERRYAMRIWLDRARLAAYGLTPDDVNVALRAQNIEVPSGRIESQGREFTVLTQTNLVTPEQFNNLILRRAASGQPGSYLVRLRDVGRAELGALNERVVVRYNARSAVALGVVKQSVANPLEVSQAVQKELPAIKELLPEGMSVDVSYDTSVFIAKSIDGVFHTIFEAIALVVLVIFFFLRSFRAILVPLVTIPVSLIGACALMALFGFSINTLTLLAMVLAIGLVVDDAIVMLENIYRHIEDGMDPLNAALLGAREIRFAILAMTMTLAAVFTPLGFLTGRTGKLFTEFALSLAGAVVVSGAVALILSPMMCSRLLRHQERHGLLYRLIEGLLDGVTRAYRTLLGGALRARWLVVLIGIGVAASSGLLLKVLKSELAPVEDRGTLIGIGIAPEGATVEFTDRYARAIERIYAAVPEIEQYFVVTGFPTVSQIVTFSRLADWDRRSRSQQQIQQELTPKLFGVPGVLAFAVNPPSFGRNARERPISFVVQTSGSYAELDAMVSALLDELRRSMPGLVNIDTDLKLTKPQLTITVDRDKTADLGIDVVTVGRTLETMLGGRQVTRFKQNDQQYDVVVQVEGVDRRNPSDITAIYMRGRDGQMIPLSNLVKVDETVAPRELNRFNRLRSATITANLAPGVTLGEALADLQAVATRVLPATALTDYAGQSREFRASSSELYVTFVLAILFIYLVLAAQFESFIDPFVIMLSVPLSMTGALLALYLTGGTLNVYSQIGLVTLVGLITKHGILIVEFTNQLRRAGRSMRDAVVESSVLRLRPILMTTGAMVLGAVPLALATGAGAESRQQIGWVIVGGMTLGTLLTLFVVPTAYTLLARKAIPGMLAVPAAPANEGHRTIGAAAE